VFLVDKYFHKRDYQMRDEVDIIKNISTIYDSNNSLRILKDFERVIDTLDIYVFKNWEDGELVEGPFVSRHWVECKFLWHKEKMPDPMGGKRLLDYGCKVGYKKDVLKKPRKIKEPSDFRPNSKKGKMEELPVWIVTVKMPKKLIFDIFKGTVRNAKDNQVDLESIYQYTDTEANTPSTMEADSNAAQQETPAAPTVGGANAPAA
jgi:hypothetical protein